MITMSINFGELKNVSRSVNVFSKSADEKTEKDQGEALVTLIRKQLIQKKTNDPGKQVYFVSLA